MRLAPMTLVTGFALAATIVACGGSDSEEQAVPAESTAVQVSTMQPALTTDATDKTTATEVPTKGTTGEPSTETGGETITPETAAGEERSGADEATKGITSAAVVKAIIDAGAEAERATEGVVNDICPDTVFIIPSAGVGTGAESA